MMRGYFRKINEMRQNEVVKQKKLQGKKRGKKKGEFNGTPRNAHLWSHKSFLFPLVFCYQWQLHERVVLGEYLCISAVLSVVIVWSLWKWITGNITLYFSLFILNPSIFGFSQVEITWAAAMGIGMGMTEGDREPGSSWLARTPQRKGVWADRGRGPLNGMASHPRYAQHGMASDGQAGGRRRRSGSGNPERGLET